jgi:hypothetical protein
MLATSIYGSEQNKNNTGEISFKVRKLAGLETYKNKHMNTDIKMPTKIIFASKPYIKIR